MCKQATLYIFFSAAFRCEASSLVQPSQSLRWMTAQAFVDGEFAGSLGDDSSGLCLWTVITCSRQNKNKSASCKFSHHPSIVFFSSFPWSWKTTVFSVLILSSFSFSLYQRYFLCEFHAFIFSITDTVESWLTKIKLTTSARLTLQCFITGNSVLILKLCC